MIFLAERKNRTRLLERFLLATILVLYFAMLFSEAQ